VPERCGAPGRRGPQWRSGGDEGVAAVASKRSRHRGGGEGVPARWRRQVPTAAACAPVTSLMAVRQWQRAKEIKNCQVIQAERRVPNL
jgi:hypothetical protein